MDNNNNNNIDNSDDDLFGMGQENEYILKIKITNVDRRTLRSLIRDESNSTYNIFALRGNLGINTTGNGNVPRLYGILSLSDSNNNNMPNGTIVCEGNNAPYNLTLDNDCLLQFCHANNTKNGKQKNQKRFFFIDMYQEKQPVKFQIYDCDDKPLSNIKFQILIVYQAHKEKNYFPGTNLTINNNGIVSFPNANLNITNSNKSKNFDTIYVNNAYIAQAIVDQLQVLSDSELKEIQTDTPFPDDVLEQVFGLNLHIYKWISNGNLDAGYIAEDLWEIGKNLQIPLIHYEDQSIKVTRENMNDRVIKDETGQKRIKEGRRLVVNSNAIRALLIRSIQNLFSNQKELSTKMNENLERLKTFYYNIYEKHIKLEQNIVGLNGRVDKLEQQRQNQQQPMEITIKGSLKDVEKVVQKMAGIPTELSKEDVGNASGIVVQVSPPIPPAQTKKQAVVVPPLQNKEATISTTTTTSHRKKDDAVENRTSTTSTTFLKDPGHWDYFISHVQSDSKDIAVDMFYSMRDQYEKTCWLDVKMQEQDEDAMKEGIMYSDLVLVIMSPLYFTRSFCVKELEWAVEYGKPLVVVHDIEHKKKIGEMLDKCPPSKKYLKGIGKINMMPVFRGDVGFWATSIQNIYNAKPKILMKDGSVVAARINPLLQTNIKNNAALVSKKQKEEILRAKPQNNNNNNNNNNNPSNAEVKHTGAIFYNLFQTHIMMNPENLNNMIENFSIMQIGDVQKIATKIGWKNINIDCLPGQTQVLNTLRKICEEGRLANDTLTPDQQKKLDEYHKYNNDNNNKINNIHIHGPAGSGKTYLALDFITKEIKHNSKTKILFVCTKNGFAKFLARWILIRIINTKEEDKSDDETKEDDATKYNPQYILNCIHFCTENTGYKAHQGILKQDSDDQPVYLHFDQIQDTDRVDEYNLIVIDEAHHIIHEENKEWKQICRDFFYKAKKRIILTDPSQDPSNMNNIRDKLAEAAAEEEEDDDQTMENIYNIELNDVVRSTERITLASHLFKHMEQTPTCKTKPFGEAVKMFMINVQNDQILNAYVRTTIEALYYAKKRKSHEEGFWDLNHRVSIIIPSNNTKFDQHEFKNLLQSELNTKTKRLKFELFSAEEMFGKFPQLEYKSVEMVVDTISNQDGLEYDIAIVVGFGVTISELRKQHNKDKTTLYRAMTRAKDFLVIVNEPVKNGFFHSTITDTTFKDDESLKKQDEGRELVVPIRDGNDYERPVDDGNNNNRYTKKNMPKKKKHEDGNGNNSSNDEKKRNNNNKNINIVTEKKQIKILTAVFDTSDISESTKKYLGVTKYQVKTSQKKESVRKKKLINSSLTYTKWEEEFDGKTKVDLGGKNLTDEDALAIGELLKTNKTLTRLDLTNNNITDVQSIGEGLKTNNTLTELCLDYNNITDVQSIIDGLKTNKTLTKLLLDNNNITDVQCIGEGLKTNNALMTLSLGVNNITDVQSIGE